MRPASTSVVFSALLGLSSAQSARKIWLAKDSAINYSPASAWSNIGQISGSNYLGGSVTHAYNAPGASATLSFSGCSSIIFIGTRSTNQAAFTVQIDGQTVDTVDPHASSAQWQAQLFSQSVSSGSHTISVIFARQQRANNYWMDVNAFECDPASTTTTATPNQPVAAVATPDSTNSTSSSSSGARVGVIASVGIVRSAPNATTTGVPLANAVAQTPLSSSPASSPASQAADAATSATPAAVTKSDANKKLITLCIALSVAAVGLLGLGLAFILWRRRKREREAALVDYQTTATIKTWTQGTKAGFAPQWDDEQTLPRSPTIAPTERSASLRPPARNPILFRTLSEASMTERSASPSPVPRLPSLSPSYTRSNRTSTSYLEL